MEADDEEREEEETTEEEGQDEAVGEKEKSLASLRESILQIVDDALKDALELRSKGRALKLTLGDELGRIRTEIRRAVEGTTAGICAIDLSTLKEGLKGRTNTLMTRVKDEDLERMDLLVEAGLFESRSQCAAFLIHAGLEARKDLVGKVQETAQRISELKEQLRDELSGEA
ncbi:MAG: hypothetical protein ACE5HJ_02535 [Thermoplasmata archaeon]